MPRELPSARAKGDAYHHGDLPNALLAAARKTIDTRGVESLSVRALAQELGVFHRAAYRHFEDKNALLAGVLTEAYLRLAKRMREVSASRPGERLIQVARIYAEFALDERNIFLAMTGPRVNLEGRYDDLERAMDAAFAPTVEAIRSGLDSKTFKRTLKIGPEGEEPLAIFFWGALQGLLTQILHDRIRLKRNECTPFVEHAARLLVSGMSF